jgi:acetoin utilization protein AcuC
VRVYLKYNEKMHQKTALIYSSKIKNYSFGKFHPFTSERFENFLKFLKAKLPNFKDYFVEIEPKPATEKELMLFHTKEYIKAIKRASKGEILPNIMEYVSIDNLDPSTAYLPKGIDQASRIAVGSALLATKLVFEGKFKKAIALGGGLHHAKEDYGEGFCIYNDVVICTRGLLNQGLERILILDTDAHAGNGVSEAFYSENRVLFIDLHQDPKTLYPGTGFLNEIGSGKGEGFTINIPLPPGTGDLAYKYCFKEVIFPIAKEFEPELIIRYGGSDPHFSDGLTNLGLTLEGFKMIGLNVRKLAEKICQGKQVDLIASGYNPEILPLAWTALLAGLLDFDIEFRELNPKLVPFKNYKLKETKETIKKLKRILKNHWRCFQ